MACMPLAAAHSISHQPSSGESTAIGNTELMLNQLAKHSLQRTAKPLLYLVNN